MSKRPKAHYLYFGLGHEFLVDLPALQILVVEVGAKDIGANVVPDAVDVLHGFGEAQLPGLVLEHVLAVSDHRHKHVNTAVVTVHQPLARERRRQNRFCRNNQLNKI